MRSGELSLDRAARVKTASRRIRPVGDAGAAVGRIDIGGERARGAGVKIQDGLGEQRRQIDGGNLRRERDFAFVHVDARLLAGRFAHDQRAGPLFLEHAGLVYAGDFRRCAAVGDGDKRAFDGGDVRHHGREGPGGPELKLHLAVAGLPEPQKTVRIGHGKETDRLIGGGLFGHADRAVGRPGQFPDRDIDSRSRREIGHSDPFRACVVVRVRGLSG